MQLGDVVEDFELPDQSGRARRLSDLLGEGPVVVFFYPAAMSTGCTAESCHFRDRLGDFTALRATPVGISLDVVARQRAFAEAHGLSFPLLSDPSGEVAGRFRIRRRLPFLPLRRHTFVIGSDRRLLGVVKSETRMDKHADVALELLRARTEGGGSAR